MKLTPQPPQADMEALIALYNNRRYPEAENQARRLLAKYPETGFLWKLLAASLQRQGKDALAAFQQTAQLQPTDAEVHNTLGNLLKDRGQLTDAVHHYRQALTLKPDYADAHNNLGITLKDLGQLNDAVNSYRQALQYQPDFTLACYNLGNALKELGQLDEAVSSYRRAIALKPDFAEAWTNLGTALKELGQFDAALTSYQRVVELKPGFAEAHNNLGVALKDLGQLDAALVSYRKAVELKPHYAEAHNNLGTVLQTLGQTESALSSYRRAVEIEPNFAEAHSNLGNILKERGQLDAAVVSCRRAIEIKPDFAEAYNNLGIAQKELGQLDAAQASYRRALKLKPDFAGAHNNLGSVLKELGHMDAAVASYRRALELKPDYAEGHSNLGNILFELGQTESALSSYRRAVELQPQVLQHAIYAHLLLPVIPDSPGNIVEWRERYQHGIAALQDMPGTLDEPGDKFGSTSFYLAYHNENDRPMMEALCRLFRARVPDLTYAAPHVLQWQAPATGQRIRVGFLSEFLNDHTIGKHYQGFIRHLDRKRFEVVVIHGAKSRRDAFRHNLDTLADKVISLPAGLKKQQQTVAAEQLDVLFYTDIGMAPSTYFLAYARLAPVQATSWGHPDTTGLDTMDYYVSAVGNEPEQAEANYTERLIRLNRLPCFYHQTPASSTPALSKAALDLPQTGTLYGCPQNLFKLHPDFDAVLAAIAEGDPSGHLLLPEGKYPAWTELLKARWAKTFPILLDRVIFLPRMPWDRFMAVIAQMDVLLDPLHFGSGNTLYDAMVTGTPVVTWPGRFARGRNVAAAYRQMGLADAPIAPRLEDYAALALALGNDPVRRQALRVASLAAASRELFEDRQAVGEFEAFLEASVAAAGRREWVQSGWRPAM